MTTELSILSRKHVPAVADTIRSLDRMGKQISLAKTYDELRKLVDGAHAIKCLSGDIQIVRDKADDVISDACAKIGEEIEKVPKANARRRITARGKSLTRKDTGIPGTTRARYLKLAQHKAKLPALRKQLREQGKEATISALVKQITQGDKKQSRAKRERELGQRQQALPDKKYGVIYADPEWRFEPWSRETGMDRAADNHYPTSVLEIIKLRPVEKIAARDCVLFLWATNPMLPHALAVMAAWGFNYVSNYCWGKDKAGTGYWNREKHELLLIGTRGNVPCPAAGTQLESLLQFPRGKHSEKPDDFAAMIEKYFPSLPKIELNRRGAPRPGWDAWGNETQLQTAAE